MPKAKVLTDHIYLEDNKRYEQGEIVTVSKEVLEFCKGRLEEVKATRKAKVKLEVKNAEVVKADEDSREDI